MTMIAPAMPAAGARSALRERPDDLSSRLDSHFGALAAIVGLVCVREQKSLPHGGNVPGSHHQSLGVAAMRPPVPGI